MAWICATHVLYVPYLCVIRGIYGEKGIFVTKCYLMLLTYLLNVTKCYLMLLNVAYLLNLNKCYFMLLNNLIYKISVVFKVVNHK